MLHTAIGTLVIHFAVTRTILNIAVLEELIQIVEERDRHFSGSG